MVYLLRAFDLRWRMGEILVNSKTEVESTAFVHALVRFDGKGKVEEIVFIGEVSFHCAGQREFRDVWAQMSVSCATFRRLCRLIIL